MIWLQILSYYVFMVLTLAFQKRRHINYDFDAKELERMIAAIGEDFNPDEGDKAEQEAPSSVMGHPAVP